MMDEVEQSGSFDLTDAPEEEDQSKPKSLQMKEEGQKILARHETRVLNSLRLAVFVLLLVVTVLVAGGTYYFSQSDEREDFEKQFRGYADRIVDSFDQAVERKLAAFDALSVAYTSHALDSEDNFPNVTLPHSEIRGSNTRILADTIYYQWLPLVYENDRAGWEAYVAENHVWLDQAILSEMDQKTRQDKRFNLAVGPTRSLQEGPIGLDLGEHSNAIYGLNDGPRSNDSGPWLVYWQVSPVMPVKSLLNFDLLTHPLAEAPLRKMLETGEAVLDNASNLLQEVDGDEAGQTQSIVDFFVENGQYRHDSEEYRGSPISDLVYPVFDNFGANRKVAGALYTNLFWREYFVNVLPDNAAGVVAVLDNTCNQTFSFFVDGTGVQYLGPSDLHDEKFDHLEVIEEVAKGVSERAGPRSRSYTTVDLHDGFCDYTLRVYPSTDLEDAFITNLPIIYTIVVASIFIFTSLVFVSYDALVARRQRIVMQRAIRSGAIVNSLFPERVQDRLFEQKEDYKKKESKPWWSTGDDGNAQTLSDHFAGQSEGAIADQFPHCTVLFADLAGFTRWSSSRDPKCVFELLETLYAAFDKIALRRKVFKIETIGDCYLCVTGLPDPQDEHSIIMCKFATEIQIKMGELIEELQKTLGSDTSELQLRVGIHSGPVTAGVLRGEKSRFQLFGDTVNTAARMESNGQKGRIHLSEETANELISRNKGHWLIERKDRILAKGKGELKTYWLHMKSARTSVASSADSDEHKMLAHSSKGH